MHKKKHLYYTSDPAKRFLARYPKASDVAYDEAVKKLAEYTHRAFLRTGERWAIIEIYRIETRTWDKFSVERRDFGDLRAVLLSSEGYRRLMNYRDAYSKNGDKKVWTISVVDRPLLGEIVD